MLFNFNASTISFCSNKSVSFGTNPTSFKDSSVPETDYDFWVVAFHGPNDETIYRRDADKNEIAGFFRDPDKYCKVWREFPTTILPSYWVVWPHSESKGWCDRLTGQLNHNVVS